MYLDVTPETGLQRARARGVLDRIEQESLRFFERTRDRYLALAAEDATIRTIDATQPLEQVTTALQSTLSAWLAEQRA